MKEFKTEFSKWQAAALILYFAFALLVTGIVFTLPLFPIMITFSVLFLYMGCFFFLAYMERDKKATPALKEWPTISIIIPAYNRGESLRRCLECVTKLEYPKKMQIMVVDDASTDQTPEIVKDFKGKGIDFIRFEKNQGKARAINTALKKAKGEIVVAMDGDSYPAPDAIMKLIPNFYAFENVGAVTTIVRVKNNHGLLQKIQEVEYFLEFGLKNSALNTMDSLYVTPGPLSAYTKEALVRMGGYDEHNITEDMEITFHLHKLGYRVVLEPRAQVFTEVPDTINKLFRQRKRWAYGGWQTIYKYRDEMFSTKKLFFRFFFPLRVVLDVSAILFLMLAVRMGLEYWHTAWGTISSYSTIAFETLVVPTLYLNSHLFLYLMIVGITLLLAYMGTRAAGAKVQNISIAGVLLFLSVYWAFIVFIQVYSLVNAIRGGVQKW
jgi:biofilm PGA synthesis N-glycosyltransferase PgaC